MLGFIKKQDFSTQTDIR